MSQPNEQLIVDEQHNQNNDNSKEQDQEDENGNQGNGENEEKSYTSNQTSNNDIPLRDKSKQTIVVTPVHDQNHGSEFNFNENQRQSKNLGDILKEETQSAHIIDPRSSNRSEKENLTRTTMQGQAQKNKKEKTSIWKNV